MTEVGWSPLLGLLSPVPPPPSPRVILVTVRRRAALHRRPTSQLDVVGPLLFVVHVRFWEQDAKFPEHLVEEKQLKNALLFLPPLAKTNHLRQLFWKLLGGCSGGRLKSNSHPLYVNQQGSPKLCVRRPWKRIRYASTRSAIKTTVASGEGVERVEKCGPLIHAVAELKDCRPVHRPLVGSLLLLQLSLMLHVLFSKSIWRIFYFKRFTDFFVCIT